MDTLVNVASPLLNLWLLIVLQRQAVRKQLPWFVFYIAWAVASEAVALAFWLLGRQLFANLYWSMEAVEIALIVAAVRESFLRIFKGFTRLTGFRSSVWLLICAIVGYSIWRAIYAPPIQRNKFGIFELAAEFLFRWSILGIALLTAILSTILIGRMDTREDAVVTGFGVAAAGYLLYVAPVSIFGTRYTFFTKYLPPMGYFFAAGWWIWVFTKPIERFGFMELGMGPEDLRKKISEYRAHVEDLLRKKR